MSSAGSALIVPIVVEALVVNDGVRSGQNWYRAALNYRNLVNNQEVSIAKANPDDDFNLIDQDPSSPTYATLYDGVYVKWRLPSALTRGHQKGDRSAFPPVPNRWLVVRTPQESGGAIPSAAWIIESDAKNTLNSQPTTMNQEGSAYLSLSGSVPTPQTIGVSTQLVSGSKWSDSGAFLNLTAVAPGNPAFSAYQPACNNVFSFVDALSTYPAGALNYQVFGWFSESAADPLSAAAPGRSLEDVMGDLGWRLDGGGAPAGDAPWTFFQGTLTGVGWTPDGVPSGGVPDPSALAVAVGNTSIEALTALIHTTSSAAAGSGTSQLPLDADLLEAFQLDLLDDLDRPDAGTVLADAVHTSGFVRRHGGYVWEIVNKPGAKVDLSADLSKAERDWLDELNRAQSELDELRRRLEVERKNLQAMWWKQQTFTTSSYPQITAQALHDAVDPSRRDPPSLAAKVSDLRKEIELLERLLPDGGSPKELESAIGAFADRKGLASHRLLKRGAAPSFFQPRDPVLLVAGAQASQIGGSSSDAVTCRIASQIAVPQADEPAPFDLSCIEGQERLTDELLPSLLAEFRLLTATSPGPSAGADPQPASNLPTTPWMQNPWRPLYLQYSLAHYPIGFDSPSGGVSPLSGNWVLDDGRFYLTSAFGGSLDSTFTPLSLTTTGFIQLTDAAAFNMQARLAHFLQTDPDIDAATRSALIQLLQWSPGAAAAPSNGTTPQGYPVWDLLSQTIDGFNAWLQLGSPGGFRTASTSTGTTVPEGLPDLLRSVGANPPNGIGPSNGNVFTPFQPWRAGQFVLSQVNVIDEWGQMLMLAVPGAGSTSSQIFAVAPSLTPQFSTPAVPLPVQVTDAPTITGASPSAVAAGSPALVVTLSGVNFASGSNTVYLGTQVLTGSAGSSTEMTVTVPSDMMESVQPLVFSFASGGTGPAFDVTSTTSPTIWSVDPPMLEAGMAEEALIALTVTGTALQGASATWNGQAVGATGDGSGNLTVQLPVEYILTPGTAELVLTGATGATGGGPVPVVAAPTVAAVTPSAFAPGQQTLTISGLGFTPECYVNWGSGGTVTALQPGSVTSNEMVVSVTTDATGPGTVQVVEGYCVPPTPPSLFVQLPPGLLQPARFNFDLVSPTDDEEEVALVAGVNPICGWVLPNHLDRSLDAYDATGRALGSLGFAYTAADALAVVWTPAPDEKAALTLAEVAHVPHLGPFLVGLQEAADQDPAVFAAFLAAIDETLWTTAPAGAAFDQNLATLMGRPLAMVRTRMSFQLYGPAYGDPSWQYTFAEPEPEILSYAFAVDLGGQTQLEDGLIGYFEGGDYATFYVAQGSAASSGSYVQPASGAGQSLALPLAPKTPTWLSMLVDPRASVHACTGILPTARVTLAPEFVDAALSRMRVTFKVDGLLADLTKPKADADDGGSSPRHTVQMPAPAHTGGRFEWLAKARNEEKWHRHPLGTVDANARLSRIAPVIHQGYLRWTPGEGAGTSTRHSPPNRPLRGPRGS